MEEAFILLRRKQFLMPRLLDKSYSEMTLILYGSLLLCSPIWRNHSTNIFGKLKYLLVGGDVLSVPHINKVRKENPDLKVINGYGPTENTTFSTCFEINREYDRNIPIGKPISNSTAYIFDKSFNYQPIGVKGELYVGGDGVSRGYLNRDDLNNISFIKASI